MNINKSVSFISLFDRARQSIKEKTDGLLTGHRTMNQEVFLAYLNSHKTPLLNKLGPRLYRPNEKFHYDRYERNLTFRWIHVIIIQIYFNSRNLFLIYLRPKTCTPFRAEPACMGVVGSIFFVKHSLTYSRGIWSLYTNCTILFSTKRLSWIILNFSFLKVAFFLLRSFKKKS